MATSVIKRNVANYTNSQLLVNGWEDTTGNCYAYRKGDVVTITLDLGIKSGVTIPALNPLSLRLLPEWAIPSYGDVAKTVTFPSGVIAELYTDNSNGRLMIFPYDNLTTGYNLYTSFTYVI